MIFVTFLFVNYFERGKNRKGNMVLIDCVTTAMHTSPITGLLLT